MEWGRSIQRGRLGLEDPLELEISGLEHLWSQECQFWRFPRGTFPVVFAFPSSRACPSPSWNSLLSKPFRKQQGGNWKIPGQEKIPVLESERTWIRCQLLRGQQGDKGTLSTPFHPQIWILSEFSKPHLDLLLAGYPGTEQGLELLCWDRFLPGLSFLKCSFLHRIIPCLESLWAWCGCEGSWV